MNKNEAILAIKNATKAITMLFSTKEEEAEFEAVKRVDSDELVDVQGELAPGTAVSVSSAMGSQAAADDTYNLANGVEFSTKGGKIDKVIKVPAEAAPVAEAKPEDAKPEEGSPEEEATETPAEEAKEDASAPVQPPDNTAAIATLVQKITELDTMINTIKTALEGKASAQAMSALGEQFNAIKGAFEVLSDTPAEFSKIDKSLEAKEDKANKLNALASIWTKK
ncbi:hypothetical protein [Mucilaginibacter ginsenosidivorax]|uniref:Uncharacterized protein n=1 Tax=Mucilaginibacter ginsenosidivorax TaxID=862126 RepID=A0A5B8W5C9_9SPHI|nr:hypothetical protein [Mucilaginibacter ginsenosidivorax]QEC78769.1 hypothetical protein FSB76_23495 [Mucilaginibacter ginsenosidivorax]